MVFICLKPICDRISVLLLNSIIMNIRIFAQNICINNKFNPRISDVR